MKPIFSLLIALLMALAAVAQKPFVPVRLSPEVITRITGKSYPGKHARVSLNDLRYIRLLHVNSAGETCEGEIIVNKKIANDVAEIFRELYEAHYPIESIRLIDDFDANDEKSMRANNSSSFCYREKAGGAKGLSRHALGMAVDINPLYNPYFKVVRNEQGDSIGYRSLEPATAEPYTDRSADFPMKLTEDDLAVRLFKQHGFTWGGNWTTIRDYQHFEK